MVGVNRMNKSFETRQFIGRVSDYNKVTELMKRQALESCHIKIGEPMLLKGHPLASEVFAKLLSGEVVAS